MSQCACVPVAKAWSLGVKYKPFMDKVELKFPVVAHQRLIVVAEKRDDAATKAAFAGFDLIEPVAESRASSGGKYVAYSLSVRLKDRAEMARLDAAIAAVPGLKMCL